MTITIGIDPGLTATGWALPDGRSGVIESKLTGVPRLDDIAKQVLQILDSLASDQSETLCAGSAFRLRILVAIEGYSYASRNNTHQLGELGGVLRLMLWREGIRFIDVAPQAVKKFAGDKGNLKKDEMRLAVYKRWGKEFKTEHEVDAFVLAKIADAIANPGAKLTKPQSEAIAKLTQPNSTFTEKDKVRGGRHARSHIPPPKGNDPAAGA